MCDDDDGAVLHQCLDGPLHGPFAFGVECCGGLVQHDDGGVLEQRTGNAETLAFAARQAPAGFTDAGVPALRQALDEFQAVCGPGGCVDFGIRRLGACHADVGQHGVVEQVHVLEHHGHQPVEPFRFDGTYVHAANGHGTVLRVGMAHQQAGDGGLAAAGGADEGGHAAGRERGRKTGQHRAGFIGKGDVIETDVELLRYLRRCLLR